MISHMAGQSRQTLSKPAVTKVRKALEEAGIAAEIVYLSDTARSAVEAARALDAPVGAIVKTLVFRIEETDDGYPLVCLISGDRRCDVGALPNLLQMQGRVTRADADYVKQVTGYSIGGVSPAGLPDGIRIVIDSSLRAHNVIWAAAGHPHCVFKTSFEDLVKLTDGLVSGDVGKA